MLFVSYIQQQPEFNESDLKQKWIFFSQLFIFMQKSSIVHEGVYK